MSSNYNLSKAALLVATSFVITACDSGGENESSGGGNVQVASDSCLAVPIANTATSYSNSVASLVDSETAGQFQFSVVQQPLDGSVTIDASTGDYVFTPNSNLADARGFKTSFSYGVLEDGEQIDSGVVELIYGDKRIMPLGDSITYGVTFFNGGIDNPAPALAVGYRKVLNDRLNEEGYSVDFVGSQIAGTNIIVNLEDPDHQGHPGWRADELANGNNTNAATQATGDINNWLVNTTPDIILSHAGTNDLFQGNTTTQAVTNVNGLITNMQTWRNSQNQPLTVLAAKIIPSFASGATTSSLTLAEISDFNTNLETNLNAAFSSDPNLNVEMVDHFSPLNPAIHLTTMGGGIGQDTVGLHPNTSGYTIMANTWYDALIATGELNRCE